MEKVRFFDGVFNADQRNTNDAIAKLAKWLTIEQLTELVE